MEDVAETRGKTPTAPQIEIELILRAEHSDPFHLLGMHRVECDGQPVVAVRAFMPEAAEVSVVDLVSGAVWPMARLHPEGFFEAVIPVKDPFPYRLRLTDESGRSWEIYDPYSFPPLLSEFDLHLFGEGRHYHIYEKLGAHLRQVNGVEGVHFAVWAPNARRVSVVGDFNRWDGRRHPMRIRGSSGVWELFLPHLGEGELYKFEIRSHLSPTPFVKADPYGLFHERPPGTASVVFRPGRHAWTDEQWMSERSKKNALDAPMAIYEVHLGSWRRGEGNRVLSYRELAPLLATYVTEMGYTHVELLPVMEHPFEGSWGYQVTGYYAPTSRWGTPDDFAFLVNVLHEHGLGVILDWVPAHFPRDDHALSFFDGTHLYNHADPRQGEHRDWGTFIFNYGRHEVRNFLLGSALLWLDKYHADGLRVDAVASMLYLDYSRPPGQWVPNIYGGRENLDAIAFLRQFNDVVHGRYPGVLTIAEESTAWPMVSRPTYAGGLGFSMKWNMGWMNDILAYMSRDPIYRKYHHNDLTFSLMYAFSENFVLPLSHDEVVHGKRSLLDKMPGDRWQKFANLRALYGYMYTHPGKKLLFMGGEFGQWREWDHQSSLEWHLLDEDLHRKLQVYVRDLNRLYRSQPALYERDFEPDGFEWIDCHDWEASVLTFLRRAKDPADFLVIAVNFTPVPRTNYRVGVPEAGFYRELLNSDSDFYGGSNLGNAGGIAADPIPASGRPYSLALTLPPLAVVILKPERPQVTLSDVAQAFQLAQKSRTGSGASFPACAFFSQPGKSALLRQPGKAALPVAQAFQLAHFFSQPGKAALLRQPGKAALPVAQAFQLAHFFRSLERLRYFGNLESLRCLWRKLSSLRIFFADWKVCATSAAWKGCARLSDMKTHTDYLVFNTRKRREYINITADVERAVRASGITEGMALVSAMHTTAGVYVNDDEDGLLQDLDAMLDTIAPYGRDYRHHETGEDNGDAHLKCLLIHHQVIIPITGGKLDLGPWQRIFYAEFDGRRRKRVVIKVMGE